MYDIYANVNIMLLNSQISENSKAWPILEARRIINQIQKKNKVQLLAIGIGHDVSKYYSNAFIIEDVDSLGDVIIENLSKMLS